MNTAASINLNVNPLAIFSMCSQLILAAREPPDPG